MAPTLTSPDMPVRMKRSGLDGEEQSPERWPVARHRDFVRSELPGYSPAPFIFHSPAPEAPKFAATRPAQLHRLKRRYTAPVAEIKRDIASLL